MKKAAKTHKITPQDAAESIAALKARKAERVAELRKGL
jgi:hypothetical protein